MISRDLCHRHTRMIIRWSYDCLVVVCIALYRMIAFDRMIIQWCSCCRMHCLVSYDVRCSYALPCVVWAHHGKHRIQSYDKSLIVCTSPGRSKYKSMTNLQSYEHVWAHHGKHKTQSYDKPLIVCTSPGRSKYKSMTNLQSYEHVWAHHGKHEYNRMINL
jgi:hypothetical protein